MKKVYIAGPDVFAPNSIQIGEHHKSVLKQFGFEGLYPLDNQCTTSIDIALGNYKLIDKCDFVIANVNSFRGFEPDSGTACEIGYAIAKGKKVYCYMSDIRSMTERYGAEEDYQGFAIENFGHPLNLMIAEKTVIVQGNFEAAVKVLSQDEAALNTFKRNFKGVL